MKPFFSYYGAKWTTARYLGPPRRDAVVEPFAGSACYSTRWDVKEAYLFDVSEDIVALWDWLIHCSVADVVAVPDRFEHIDEVMALPRGPSLLVRFWIAKGRAEPTQTLSPWYFQYRDAPDCSVWGPYVKQRVVTQKPGIASWKVAQLSYTQIPNCDAHWHIDPPYEGDPGRRYTHDVVDYAHLALWAQGRFGAVDVCENEGASWLPFTKLAEVVTSRGRRDGHRSIEAVWRKDDPVRRCA